MDLLLPLISFIVVTALTPGPNNLLLAAVGMNFGFKAAIPQIVGIYTGVASLLILCALGLDQVIHRQPQALLTLKIFGSVYLLYLAWRITGIRLNNADDQHGISKARPLSVLQSYVFQFSNPKAWMMVTTGIGVSLPLFSSMLPAVVALLLGFATLGLTCNFIWVLMGSALKNVYAKDSYRIAINLLLCSLIIATVTWLWLP